MVKFENVKFIKTIQDIITMKASVCVRQSPKSFWQEKA